MADIVDEFKTYLKTISGVTSLVGSSTSARIYDDTPKQNVSLPFLVVVEGGGGQSNEYMGGIAGMAEAVLHVYAFGTTRAAANALAEAVRLAPVQGYRGLMGSTQTRCLAGSHRDSGVDDPRDGSYAPRFWCRRIFNVFHYEATS